MNVEYLSYRLNNYLFKYVLKNKKEGSLLKVELKITLDSQITERDCISFFNTYFDINITENYRFVIGNLNTKFYCTLPYFINDECGLQDFFKLLKTIDDFFVNLQYKKSGNVYKFCYDSPKTLVSINILKLEVDILILKQQTDFLI